MKIQIIGAKQADRDELIHIQNRAFYDDYEKYNLCPLYNMQEDSMEQSIERYMVYKILLGETLVGDVIMRQVKENHIHIRCLCIVPEYENLGIGQEVMKRIMDQYPREIVWSLETFADKERTQYFYKKLGFQVAQQYWYGNIKLVLMEK